ncbi:MAG: hypothetical protein Q9197_003868 [Variospora fuerteventurae]
MLHSLQIEMNPTPVKAVQEGLERIFKGLLSLKSGPRRILNVTPDAAHAGKRVAPAQTSKNDQYCSVRIDQGMPIKDKPNFVMMKLQPNSKCDIPSVQELSNRVGTHYVIAEVEMDTTQDATAENTEKLWEQFSVKIVEAANEVAKEKESKKEGKGGQGEKGGK